MASNTDFSLERSENNATDLITLYVPAGKSRVDISNLLKSEMSTCRNIKDRSVRASVTDTLKSCI